MADCSTTSSASLGGVNGRSPISNIPRDQVYAILLLLPPESVVAFAMTCKKFRSMASSDALWESLCVREWGPSSVGWFKSSKDHRQLPWMKLFEMVSRSDSVSCRRLLSDSPECPDPRASHSLNFVSDSLVLFGGGREGGRHLDDTWVAHVGGDGEGAAVKWQKVNSGLPSGRFGHSCVAIGDSLVLFGGIDDHGSRLNDTWIGQVALSPSPSVSWELLPAGPGPPPPRRGAHGACCVAGRRMVVHGGIGADGVRLADTWLLELSEDSGRGAWSEVGSDPSPPARSGHTLTSVGGSRAVLFGGRGTGYEVLDDVWVLDAREGRLAWARVPFRDVPGGASLRRVGHSAAGILGGRVLIYGGEDSSRRRKSDFWVLDLDSLAKIWRGFKVRGNEHESRRSFHRACVDQSGHRVYVFGGMVDGLVQPAEPFGLGFDGDLFLVELVLQV